MDKETLRMLSSVVNDPAIMNAFAAYVKYRKEYHYAQLTYCDEVAWRRSQGALDELARILNLRDEVNQKVKDLKNA
jgi:succinylarginine dihydrolase